VLMGFLSCASQSVKKSLHKRGARDLSPTKSRCYSERKILLELSSFEKNGGASAAGLNAKTKSSLPTPNWEVYESF
jgi:hypothetical protein